MTMDKDRFVKGTYEKIADEYTKEYIDDLSDVPYIDGFLSLLPAKAKVLDVGSGPGQFSHYIKEKGFSVQGIDMSTKMLEIAKERFPDISFKEMDMRALQFGDGSFDGLLAAYSIIHIPTEEIPEVLKEFSRVLKPDGHLMIIAQEGIADQIVDEPLMEGEKIFVNFFSLDSLSGFVKDSGFEIVKAEIVGSTDENSLSKSFINIIAKKI